MNQQPTAFAPRIAYGRQAELIHADDVETTEAWLRRISSGSPVISVTDIRVNGEPVPPMPAEACTELGADTASPPLDAWVRARIWLLENRLATVIDEQRRYEQAGIVGQVYQLNSLNEQFKLMARIAVLKGLGRINTQTGERQ